MIRRLKTYINRKLDAAVVLCFKVALVATICTTVFFALTQPQGC